MLPETNHDPRRNSLLSVRTPRNCPSSESFACPIPALSFRPSGLKPGLLAAACAIGKTGVRLVRVLAACVLLAVFSNPPPLCAETVDLLVVYTPAAREVMGGTENVALTLHNSIRTTNDALENSGVTHRVRLVHYEEVAYTEASATLFEYPDDEDFRYLKTANDGVLDEVMTLRDLYRADTTIFINGRSGGKGQVPGEWALVGAGRLGDFTFAHELGHNFGCNHALGDMWSDDSPPTQKRNESDYAFGWHFTAGGKNYCTIMAYPGAGEEQLPYYSTPGKTHLGEPLGDAEDGDNVRKMEIGGYTLAARRNALPAASAVVGISATDMAAPRITITWNSLGEGFLYQVFRKTGSDDPVPLGIWQEATSFVDAAALAITPHDYFVVGKKPGAYSPGPLVFSDTGSRMLSPPPNVDATDGEFAGQVTIAWDPVFDTAAYRVYRSETATGALVPIGDWQSEASAIDHPPLGNTTYFYRVKAALDLTGAGATLYSDFDRGHMKLASMNCRVSRNNPEYVEILWSANPYATHYRVSRSDFSDGPRTQISDWQTGTSFRDASTVPGVVYYYAVRCAPSSSGAEPSSYAAIVSGWRQFQVPDGVVASRGTFTSGIDVSWNHAPEGNPRYQVRWQPTDGSADATESPWGFTPFYFATANIVPGKSYRFCVRASKDEITSHATPWTPWVYGSVRLAAPAEMHASNGLHTDRIVLNCATVAGATSYQFYRSATLAGPKEEVTSWQPENEAEDLVAPGTTYLYWARAGNGSSAVDSDYSSVDLGESGILPPENLQASKGTNHDYVAVSWDLQSGTRYYKLFRAESLDGPKSEVQGWTSQMSFYNDSGAEEGHRYYYWVKVAASSSGRLGSAFSSYDTGFRTLPAPVGVQATRGAFADSIRVQWDASEGASHYRVFRSATSDGVFSPVADWQTQTTFNDPDGDPGVTYYYHVRAAASPAGLGESPPSAVVAGAEKGAAPVWAKISRGTSADKVALSWSSAPDILYFQIYRSESPDGTMLRILDWTAGHTHDDLTAESGKTYYYQVVGAKGSAGSQPTIPSEFGQGWISPAPPGTPTVSDLQYTDKIEVSWETAGPGLFYRVLRQDIKAGPFNPVGSWQAAAGFSDFTAEAGRRYSYAIQAANDDTGTGASARGPDASGARRLSPATHVQAGKGKFPDKVPVIWNPVRNAACYRVFRAAQAGGASEAISGWIQQTVFEDRKAVPGVVYNYTVRCALDFSASGESDDSAPDAGWREPPGPDGVEATDGEYTSQVLIVWDDLPTEAWYQVSRADSLTGEKSPLSPWISGTEWSDTSASPGQTYYYFVKASASASGTTGGSFSEDTGWRGIQPPEAPVQLLPVHLGTKQILLPNLSWSLSERADVYRLSIWSAQGPYGEFGKDGELDPRISGLASNNCTLPIELEAGTKYYWQVFAANQGGETGSAVWEFTTSRRLVCLGIEVHGGLATIRWEALGDVWIDFSPDLDQETPWTPYAGPVSGQDFWSGPLPAGHPAGFFRLRSDP